MTVQELRDKLEAFQPDDKVYLPGEGHQTDAGTWLEGEDVELDFISYYKRDVSKKKSVGRVVLSP